MPMTPRLETDVMDRRTLLAMVLLFALFMVWSKLYMKWYGPDEDAAVETSAVEAPLEAAGSEPVVARALDDDDVVVSNPAAMPAADDVASTVGELPFEPLSFSGSAGAPVTVVTDLYRMVVDPSGGTVTSWQGLEFSGIELEGNVELVPARGELDPAPKGDVLMFERGELDLSEAVFTVEGSTTLDLSGSAAPRELALVATTDGGVTVRKIFTFRPATYDFDVNYEVSAVDATARAIMSRTLGEPVSARFTWSRGIEVTEKAIKAAMRRPTSDRAFAMVGEELEFKNQGDLDRDDGKAFGAYRGSVRFAGAQNKYFMIAGFLPDSIDKAVEGRIRLGGDRETMRQSWEIELPLRRSGSTASSGLSYYFGPSDFDGLKVYGSALERTVNLGWKWIQPISELVLGLMNWLHRFIPNYGWVIVVISVLSKLVFWPLTAKGTKSMRKTAESQARLKPRLDEAKKKHGKDAQRYNQEMMKIYKEEGVNPMAGMAGCLPMMIQMPVFLALYQVLYNMVDLRHAPWMLWIHDLSQPDMLATLPVSLPILGPNLNVLPLIMAVATYLQTKMTPQTGAAGGQMAAMNKVMPIMMLFFLYNMPAGLVIYWTINTGMTALQSWQVNRAASATGGTQTA